jgi:hypothetical protein
VPSDARVLQFTIIAVAFLLFAIPCFLFVKERGNPHPRPILSWTMIKESTAQTIRTLREGHRYPGLLRFLVGRVFYTDAINTVISYMSLYTVNAAVALGLTKDAGEDKARLVLMCAISFAVLGGFAWGWLVDRIGPKRTLDWVLGLWVVTFLLAASIGLFHLPLVWLFVVCSLAGIALGGVWAADRPYMLRLTPPDRIGEFYGLYGMVGRFSAVSGPLLWSLVTYVAVERAGLPVLTGQSMAILSLLGMIIVSYVILRPVQDKRTRDEGRDRGGRGLRSEASPHLAVAADEKLREVPFDRRRAEHAFLAGLQPREQRRCMRAVHVHLREHRKRHVVLARAEVANLVVRSRLLVPELIARKPEHHEAGGVMLPVKRLEAAVLRRVSALARHIDDEQHLASIAIEAHGGAVDGLHIEVVQAGNGRGGIGHIGNWPRHRIVACESRISVARSMSSRRTTRRMPPTQSDGRMPPQSSR